MPASSNPFTNAVAIGLTLAMSTLAQASGPPARNAPDPHIVGQHRDALTRRLEISDLVHSFAAHPDVWLVTRHQRMTKKFTGTVTPRRIAGDERHGLVITDDGAAMVSSGGLLRKASAHDFDLVGIGSRKELDQQVQAHMIELAGVEPDAPPSAVPPAPVDAPEKASTDYFAKRLPTGWDFSSIPTHAPRPVV